MYVGENPGLKVRRLGLRPSSSFTYYVTLVKLLDISESQFAHFQNESITCVSHQIL